MRRSELEHVIRAACDIADERDLVIIGSQAILGQFPDAPPELLVSEEVDLYPSRNPEAALAVEGVLGEDSQFHSTFGIYVHGVGPETAILPERWQDRLVPLSNENTRRCTGWCLEAHDIAASKLAAGRQKDVAFVAALLRHDMVSAGLLDERIRALPLSPERREHLARTAKRLGRDGG